MLGQSGGLCPSRVSCCVLRVSKRYIRMPQCWRPVYKRLVILASVIRTRQWQTSCARTIEHIANLCADDHGDHIWWHYRRKCNELRTAVERHWLRLCCVASCPIEKMKAFVRVQLRLPILSYGDSTKKVKMKKISPF